MKKPTIKQQSGETLKSGVRFSPLVAAFAVLFTGGIGAAILRAGFAQPSPYANGLLSVSFAVRDYSPPNYAGTDKGYSGGVTIYATPNCGPASITLTNGGTASFRCDGGQVGVTKIVANGYVAAQNPPGIGWSWPGQTFLMTEPFGSVGLNMLLVRTPTVSSFSASAETINKGASTTLSWNSSQATACTASGGWSGNQSPSGAKTISPTVTTDYSLTCSNPFSSSSTTTKRVTVNTPATSKNSTKKATPNNTTPANPSTTTDTTAPTKPENAAATLQDNTVRLTWSAASDNLAVTSYSVERSTDTITWEMLSKTITGTSYEDSSLPLDAGNLYYRISSLDAAGNTSEAAFADVDIDSSNTNDSTLEQDTVPSTTTKKKNVLPLILKIAGGTLIVAAIGGAVLWYRWRKSQYAKGPSVSLIIPNAATSTGQPHQTKSLKDMVMEDYPTNQNSRPPEPPQTPPS